MKSFKKRNAILVTAVAVVTTVVGLLLGLNSGEQARSADKAAASATLRRLADNPVSIRQYLDPGQPQGKRTLDAVLAQAPGSEAALAASQPAIDGYPSYAAVGVALDAATVDPNDPAAIRIFTETMQILGNDGPDGTVPTDLAEPLTTVILRFLGTGQAEYLARTPLHSPAPIVKVQMQLARSSPNRNTRLAAATLTFIVNLASTAPISPAREQTAHGAGALLAYTCMYPYAWVFGMATPSVFGSSGRVLVQLAQLITRQAATATLLPQTFAAEITGPGVHMLGTNGRPFADVVQQSLQTTEDAPDTADSEVPTVTLGNAQETVTGITTVVPAKNPAVLPNDRAQLSDDLGGAFPPTWPM